jgi:MFS superfamily sulfate permease-like transporter
METSKYSFNIFRKDFLSGIIVFLIALPLCLGIAQASGAPLFAGIVAGIVGGIVVGSLSGSQLSVTGPAAGLTAIVMLAITQLKEFDIFLCCVIIAGLIQLGLGFLRAGGIANFIPSSVIEGMLAGIGLTIIIKQIPDAVGYAKNAQAVMVDADDGFVAAKLAAATHHIQVGAVIVALIGLAILILWSTKALKRAQIVPAGLLVVVVGTIVNALFLRFNPALYLDSAHLVKLPVADSLPGFFKQFKFPNLNGFTSLKVWETGIVIAIVASIETLLCIEATDKLDPMKRNTSTNRELKAQGIGNMVSGFLGGLPVTSVIVRSSANVNAGAKSKASAIIHGVLLLVCAASIPFVLNMIPKSALAAILLFTGYRLCKPSFFVHMWKGGATQFIPFIVTTLGVVGLDLLKGVGLGLLISIIYLLRHNARVSYFMNKTPVTNGEDSIKITLAQEVSFLNKASIKSTLYGLPEGSNITIDASETQYIDFDVLNVITDFRNGACQDRNINITLVGFKDSYGLNSVAENTTDKNSPQLQHTPLKPVGTVA